MGYGDPRYRWPMTDREGARRALRRAVELRVGWKRMGVRGWVHRLEAEHLVYARLDEQLPLLVRAGDAERVDAREPGRQKPAWIYRLTDQGERESRAGLQPLRVPRPRPDPADDGLFLMPAEQWEPLGWLRAERAAISKDRWTDQPGWYEMSEITFQLPHTSPDAVRALAARGWLERTPVPGTESQRNPRYLYRASDRAMALTLHDAATELFVELRLGNGAG